MRREAKYTLSGCNRRYGLVLVTKEQRSVEEVDLLLGRFYKFRHEKSLSWSEWSAQIAFRER